MLKYANSVENATSADSHQQKEMDTANSVDNATSADQQQHTEMEHSNSVEANESAKNRNTLEVNKERIFSCFLNHLNYYSCLD
jgi:hypothetical protein